MEARKFKTKGELKAVVDSVEDEEERFECEICRKVFSFEDELTTHEIQHMKLTCGLYNQVGF